jgi:hypothetical protein
MNKYVFLILIYSTISYSQPKNINETALIHPSIINTNLMFVKEIVKQTGLSFKNKTNNYGTKYLFVQTQTYSIIYYYSKDEILEEILIVDTIIRYKKWNKYYVKLANKWPKLWAKESDFLFYFYYSELNTDLKRNINIQKDFEGNILTVRIK